MGEEVTEGSGNPDKEELHYVQFLPRITRLIMR